jgi:hypothetical protein
MKNFIKKSITLICIYLAILIRIKAQSVLLQPNVTGGTYRITSNTQEGIVQNRDEILFNFYYGFGSYVSEDVGLFYSFGYNDPLKLNVIGYTRFEIVKYQNARYNCPVRLGTDAPAIRIKELAGFTAATQGNATFLSHGISAQSIISVRIIIDPITDVKIAEEYKDVPGFQASISYDNDFIEVFNKSGNSSGILNKPLRVLITYMN